jgi:hypothetical protein
MPFDLDLTLNVLYPAANAAYLVMNGTTAGLSLPPGYTVVGQIVADPQSAANVMAQAPPTSSASPTGWSRRAIFSDWLPVAQMERLPSSPSAEP